MASHQIDRIIPGLDDLRQEHPSTVTDVKVAEMNRRNCMREIAKLMGKINDSKQAAFLFVSNNERGKNQIIQQSNKLLSANKNNLDAENCGFGRPHSNSQRKKHGGRIALRQNLQVSYRPASV